MAMPMDESHIGHTVWTHGDDLQQESHLVDHLGGVGLARTLVLVPLPAVQLWCECGRGVIFRFISWGNMSDKVSE